MTHTNFVKKSSGFTLFEFLAVLVAIAILTAGISGYVLSSQASANAEEETKQAAKVTECVKDARTAPTYAGLDTQTLIDTRCLDNLNMLNPDRDAIINNYGGAITVEPVEYNGVDDLAVEVVSGGYNQEQCVNAVQHRIRIAPVVAVDGEEVKAQGDDIVNVDIVTDACDSDALIEISWIVTR